jgi:hypothetical protein
MATAIKAGIVYFAAVFAAGFLLGTIRVLALTPHIDDVHAVLIELPLMLVLSWHVSRWLTARADDLNTFAARLVMGGFAFGLLMFGEAGVATFGFGRTLAEHVANYATAPAALGLAGQIAFAAFPAIQLLIKTD